MRWRRGTPPPPAEPDTAGQPATMSDETRRAQAAAAQAALDLAVTRRQAARATTSADQLEQENQHNGFYMLIRHALGAG